MTDRRELLTIARELKKWLEWQGADDDIGAIPASEQKRRAMRERIEDRREARSERIQASLRQGPEAAPTPEPDQTADEEPAIDDELLHDLGTVRSGAGGGTPDGGREARASSDADDSETSTDSNADKLEYLREYLGECRRCPLWENRQNIVFGEGNPEARLVFVGEAPGRREDETGRPFVGRAGQLLDDMIRAMGLERDDTYICNVLKSRPPDNRDPRPDEIRECFPFLRKQLDIIDPEVIVTLGRPATQTLLDTDRPLGALRGTWHDWEDLPVMPTYHPAYLLRNGDQKRKTWNDLQHVIRRLDLPGPE